MDAPDRARRTWIMTLRRFLEVAWTRHGVTRYASVLGIPVIVALTVPGWWWALCVLGALAGMGIDLKVSAGLTRTSESLDHKSEAELRALATRHIWAVAFITAAYGLPYVALAMAPGPGPLIGLMYCAGSAIVITSLHVMTRNMILYTVPTAAVGLAANAFALAPGWQGIFFIVLAGVMALNVVVTARAGGITFGDLISARLSAEFAAEDLERRVEARTVELVEVSRAAEAASKAKSAFLANMSHELRTPLNAIIGYSEIIEEDLASGDTKACPQDIARVRTAAVHLLGLIADVLDISKIEAEKLGLAPQDVDVAALAREVVETVAPLVNGNDSVCDVIVEPCATTMHADPMRVKQCLMNLLSNAAKFTRNGRVVLHVRRVHFNGVDALAFAVRDTGIGISAENLERLFQPFVQADVSITRAYGGTGLGLAITRRFARLMGGDVLAESELGRGSKFTLVVPCQPEPTAQSEPRSAAA